jgi:hypothetical protein
MEAALYDADAGFYATGGRAGRRGDFITSAEVGPLFGAVVAQLDGWWAELGRRAVAASKREPGWTSRVGARRPACAGPCGTCSSSDRPYCAERTRGLPLVLPCTLRRPRSTTKTGTNDRSLAKSA